MCTYLQSQIHPTSCHYVVLSVREHARNTETKPQNTTKANEHLIMLFNNSLSVILLL
eukprot:m.94833 g.94833  ORF g.94833 m.94833 type:complete len:57 (+) comp26758_c1_seq1:396-566(+)